MHVLLKGLSLHAKEECRSTPSCFKDCLNIMPHKSGVYSSIGVKFSGFVLLINYLQVGTKKEAFQDIKQFNFMSHTHNSGV